MFGGGAERKKLTDDAVFVAEGLLVFAWCFLSDADEAIPFTQRSMLDTWLHVKTVLMKGKRMSTE